MATKRDIERLGAKLDTRVERIDVELRLDRWMLGGNELPDKTNPTDDITIEGMLSGQGVRHAAAPGRLSQASGHAGSRRRAH